MTERIQAIVLAAGGGRRFGGGKLLADWNGGPLIRASAAIALAAPVDRVVVVLGDRSDELRNALAPLASPRLMIAVNEDWPRGLGSSLAIGVSSLPPATQAAFVFLADMPLVPPTIAGRLLSALRPGDIAAVPEHSTGAGHPVLLTAALFAAARSLQGDRGLRGLLNGANVRRVPVADDGVVADIDTPSDLRTLQGKIAMCGLD